MEVSNINISPQIFTAKVMHKRLFPKVNQFTYGVYYMALPLSWVNKYRTPSFQQKPPSGFETTKKDLSVNKFSSLSFYEKDHGPKDGGDLERWARPILVEHNLSDITDEIMLVAMPRVLGYVFNPVSFWLCLDKERQLRAVLCEVNNTFGETHIYLCMHEDRRVIDDNDWLDTDKVFHVSPFLPREGSYRFRFSLAENKLGIWIDYFAASGEKQLITALTGKLTPLTRASLRKAFWMHPLVTVKAIALIHWQALKLFSKGIKYIIKPQQREACITTTNLTKH